MDVERFLQSPRDVFVVDDATSSGDSIQTARRLVSEAALPHRVRYGSVYVNDVGLAMVDEHRELLTSPMAFEWNILHNAVLKDACLDMDGVLCFDPSREQDDDDERYRDFLANAQPLLKPSRKVKYIVTSRLEKWRNETEAWLKRNGVEFDELVMLDLPDLSTRRELRSRSAFKADVYRESNAAIFVESSLRQSVEIANLAKRDVLCVDTMQLISPGSLPTARPSSQFLDVNRVSPLRRAARAALPTPAKQVIRRIRNLR